MQIVNADPTVLSKSYETRGTTILNPNSTDLKTQTISELRLSPTTSSDILLFKFLSYFSQDQGGRTWHATLPRLITAKNKIAMKAAARAVSLAYAAQNLHDPSMAHAAREYYGNSLRYHQYSFRAPPGKAPCKAKAFNAVPVTVLLSYFEMMQATSADAWLKHTLAAERLFALLDRDTLQDELLNHLYFIVRANAAVRCFLHAGRSELGARPWGEVGFIQPCGRSTAAFHDVVDILIKLTSYINVGTIGWSDSPSNEIHEGWLELVLLKLFTCWQAFAKKIGLDTRTCSLLLSEVIDYALPVELQEPSAALTAAFFHAAVLLTLRSLQQVYFRDRSHPGKVVQNLLGFDEAHWAGNSSIEEYTERRCDWILTITDFLRWTCVGCSCVRMLLPLVVTNRLAPRLEQRLMAEKVFLEWSKRDGLPGLGLFAFGTADAAQSG